MARLHPGVIMVVPNGLLQAWFPPNAPYRALDQMEIAAAQAHSAKFGCVFHYSPLRLKITGAVLPIATHKGAKAATPATAYQVSKTAKK